MDTFHIVLVYAGYVVAIITLVTGVVLMSSTQGVDEIDFTRRGVKAVGWALLLALASSILDRLVN